MSVATSQHKNFVGGEFVDAVEGGTAEIINPSTGETIAEVPNGTQADVDRAVEAAKRAWLEWRDTTPQERSEMLLKLADAIDTHTDESTPCRINPLGAKGVGELGTVGGTPTIINALLDALRPHGVTDIAMPATPERVWRALRDARG